MNQVSLDSAEMKSFLQHIINNNRHIQKDGKKPVATEVIGESGLGKTSVALQIAEENNLSCVKLNLAQIEDLGDLVGFPLRQFQLCKEGTSTEKKTEVRQVLKKVKLPNGMEVTKKVNETVEVPGGSESECIWVDENATNEYLKQGYRFTGEKRMSYCPPEWIANKEGGGILILDDWNRADVKFIQAVMELVDRQEYLSWKLPDDWHIVLTANPDDGNYLVNSIDVAQRTRFVSVILKWNHERWAEWAETQKVDGRCINFVLMNPEVVNEKVNPRSLTTFFKLLETIPSFEKDLPLIQMCGEGSVGPEVSTLFTSFINNRLDRIISPKRMLLHKDEKEVIDELLSSICDGGNPAVDYRADIASILSTRLINFTLNYAESNPVTPEIVNRISALIKHPDVFTNDLKYHLAKKIIHGNKTKFQKLFIDPQLQKLVMK
jgi:hypothetical protein